MRTLGFLLALTPTLALAAPPIRTPIQAVARLRKPDLADAVKAVDAACRGRDRRVLVDSAPLVAEIQRLAGHADSARQRAGLDLHRCLSDRAFVKKLLEPAMASDDPARVAYAAEVSARVGNSASVPVLLAALEARAAACAKPGLAEPEVERCVWLVYAPGPSLEGADAQTRTRAGEAVAKATTWPYPKMREVAVESLAATEQKKFAAPIRTLIEAEKAGRFEPANEAALLRRFAQRAAALSGR